VDHQISNEFRVVHIVGTRQVITLIELLFEETAPQYITLGQQFLLASVTLDSWGLSDLGNRGEGKSF